MVHPVLNNNSEMNCKTLKYYLLDEELVENLAQNWIRNIFKHRRIIYHLSSEKSCCSNKPYIKDTRGWYRFPVPVNNYAPNFSSFWKHAYVFVFICFLLNGHVLDESPSFPSVLKADLYEISLLALNFVKMKSPQH